MKNNIKDKAVTTEAKSSAQKSGGSAGKVTLKEKTPEEKRQSHIEGIIKTAVAAYIGIVAGAVAYFQFGVGADSKWYAMLTVIAILAYYIQRLIYPPLKINPKEFGLKGWLYVEFIVVDFCLVTWTLLLN